jgi:hypothetical protein
MRPSRKQVGCCTLCGKEVFGVRARWPNDHPLAGEVRKIGKPLSSARCVRLLLMSGAQCTVTLCDRCHPTPERLPELWTVCCQANAQELEDERRTSKGSSPVEGVIREKCIDSVQQMVVDLPIAVLSIHPWEKDNEFTARS